MSKQFQKLIILLLSINMFGCGYFSDEPIENADTAFVANVLEGDCTITEDAEKITKLFEENVNGSLDCLRKGLKTYTEVSKRSNPKFITLSELETFINENLSSSTSPESLSGKLSLFFRLGNVLLNEPKNSLSVRNIDAIFDLLQVLNLEAIQLRKAIKGADDIKGAADKSESENFLKYSRDFSRSLIRLVDFFTPVLKQNLAKGEIGHTIDLKALILDVFEGDSFGTLDLDEKTLEAILSFKTLFLGGEKIFLNTEETLRFLENSPDLVTAVFNLCFSNKEDLSGKNNHLVYFQKNLNLISEQMYSHGERTVITTQEEIDLIFNKYLDDMEGMSFLQPTVKELKNKLIDGKDNYSDIYTFKNVRSLFSLADIGIDTYLYYLNNQTFFNSEETLKPRFTKRGRISKQDFANSTSNLAETLRLKIDKARIFPPVVEYFEFFKFLNKEKDNLNISEEVLDAAVGIKTVFMGGAKEVTNKAELLVLLNKLSFLGNLYYDLSSLDTNNMTNLELLELALNDIRAFRDNVDIKSSFRPAITAENIITLVEKLQENSDYKNYIPLINSLKLKILKRKENYFTVGDFVTLADLLEEFTERLYFAEITFDHISPSRRGHRKIKVESSELTDAGYSKIPLDKQVLYLEEFNKILNSYRYYRDEAGYSYYGNEIKRYVSGLREVVAVKWAADLLLPIYGKKSKDKTEYVLDDKKLDCVLYEFKPVLEQFSLWSKNIKTFGRNILLLADLFQEQSDGTLDINAVETAEYGSLVFMAVKVGEEMLRNMVDKGYCTNMGTTEAPVVTNDCYRQYFFKSLMTDLGLKSYMTKLYDYVVGSDYDEVINFLKSVEGFARDPDNGLTDLRLAKVIFGAMLNIESTLIRFDLNQDNILNFDELNKGFEVYDDAVIGLAGLQQAKWLAPKAYFYMIDKMKLPPEGKLKGAAALTVYFYPKKIKAKRLNVGKLLEGIITKANESIVVDESQTLEEQFASCREVK